MEVPKLSKQDMYKFLMYTLLKNNFTVLSTETIAESGAKITTHDEQFFKEHKVGAPKLNTLFWTSKSKLNKGAKIHACWILFGITARKKKKKEDSRLQEFAAYFPMITTQELVDWAKKCHPNVSIHAYDTT